MLDAKETNRHFQVKTAKGSTSEEVVFEKLALVNGKQAETTWDRGGAVLLPYETGATRFENVIFKDNTVPDAGGALYATRSGKATFSSCRFIGNKAKGGNAQVRSSPIPPSISFCLNSPLDLSRAPSITVCQFVIWTSDSLRFGIRAFCL